MVENLLMDQEKYQVVILIKRILIVYVKLII